MDKTTPGSSLDGPDVLEDVSNENLGILRAIIDGYGPNADAIMEEFRKDTSNGLLQMPEKDFVTIPIVEENLGLSQKAQSSHKVPSMPSIPSEKSPSHKNQASEVSPKMSKSS